MKGTKYMKQKRVSVMMIGATMLLALMAGCATTTTSTQDTANMLVAAGFKTITPKTTAQQQKLHQLQTGQVAMVHKNGGTYYVVADPEKKELLKFEWGMDFGAPHETEITKLYDKPVFVYGYPSAVKAFYMEPWPGCPEVCKSVDLLAPEGYGEICGGSERISDHDALLARIQKEGLPEEAFKWYLELRKYGSVPHSGFGMGVERVTAWLCGIEHIREAIPFPRTIKRVYP